MTTKTKVTEIMLHDKVQFAGETKEVFAIEYGSKGISFWWSTNVYDFSTFNLMELIERVDDQPAPSVPAAKAGVKLSKTQRDALRKFSLYSSPTPATAISVRLTTALSLADKKLLYNNGLDEFAITPAGFAALASAR